MWKSWRKKLLRRSEILQLQAFSRNSKGWDSTPGCVTVAPLTVIFAYFLFRVKNYLDITEMRPARRWKALMLYFTILI